MISSKITPFLILVWFILNPIVLTLVAEDVSLEIVRINDREGAKGPKVLCIQAHPDDETAFAATLYKTSTHLDGQCDILLITNGEGGFKYSTLAESIYGLELTDETIGRKELPEIRKKEFVKGCRYMNIRQAFFLNQRDHRYSLDPNEILKANPPIWNLKNVSLLIDNIIEKGNYDFIFTHLPVEHTHAHHKCASILALESVNRMMSGKRPIILGTQVSGLTQPAQAFNLLENFPITEVYPNINFKFDRKQSFGYEGRLNYKIIVDWVIAEHKSQGTMQLYAHQADEEHYSLYKINPEKSAEKCKAFFDSLSEVQFKSKTYGASAGVKKSDAPK